MKRIAVRSLSALLMVMAAAVAQAQTVEPHLKALLQKHYRAYGAGGDPAGTFAQTTVPRWANCSGNGAHCQTREELVGQLQGLHQLIPDMQWEILETLVSGDKVIVRGQGSGTPAGEFFGMPSSGRSFKVMSIDIHTLSQGKISHTFHLEDWATALRQLSGR